MASDSANYLDDGRHLRESYGASTEYVEGLGEIAKAVGERATVLAGLPEYQGFSEGQLARIADTVVAQELAILAGVTYEDIRS